MLNNKEIKELIEHSYQHRDSINQTNNLDLKQRLQSILKNILTELELGNLRVAQKTNDIWVTNSWVKKAILLSFIINDNQLIVGVPNNYFDKILPRFQDAGLALMKAIGARIVPPACIRTGAYVGKNTIIMPSYINIGAYVDENSMIDSWATVGSCAQIGKNVHISAGASIGGVLEPMQDNPTIIEDNCFVGAGSQIVEGVIVEKNSVIATGVFLGKSTKIYDRISETISYGTIPSGSVVVPGNLPSDDGKYSLYCVVIVKKVDAKTLQKVGINNLLRHD